MIDSAPAPSNSSRAFFRAIVWRFSRNLYFWFKDDLLAAHPHEMLRRAYRRLKKGAQVFHLLPGRPEASPHPPGLEFLQEEENLDEIRRVIEANYQARMAYKPRPYPGQITLLRARYDAVFRPRQRDLGWSKVAMGAVTIYTLRGSHGALIEDPLVQELADRLRECLDEADRSCAEPGRDQ